MNFKISQLNLTVILLCAILYLISNFQTILSDENILCTESSCKSVSCNNSMPERCKKPNATYNGVHLPSPEICNCCDYCLANLVEGEVCSVGNPSSLKATSVCGPGLTCIPKSADVTDGTCQKMDTDCTKQQVEYDTKRKNGYLGSMEMRAACDDDGNFATYKCIPGQTCYCLDVNGTRIFGEADYSNIDNYMNCGCSRSYYDAITLIGREIHPTEHFRCNARGDYDTVQCIGDKCLCVDTIDGAPTYPKENMVNISLISNKTLPCFKSKEVGLYYTKCEEEFVNIYGQLKELLEDGYNEVIGFNYPKCDFDGSYQAVQQNATHKFCVDKIGAVLAVVHIQEQASLANNMDCKCARALSIMTTNEKPTCQANGNYEPIQCRRGTCRCVDSDGNQKCSSATKNCEEVDELQKSQLKC